MKVVFAHAPASRFLTGDYFSSYFHNFFYLALPRNGRIDYEIIISDKPTKRQLDADFVILFSVCEKLGLIELPSGIRAKVVANAYDSSYINKEYIANAERCGCECFFYHHTPKWFYRFAPAEWKYKQIQMVLEPSWYQRVTPWDKRQRNIVLLTGKTGNDKHYYLRKKLHSHDTIKWVPQHKAFCGEGYRFLLQNFCAHISACSVTTVNKYVESLASGCLTFAEANSDNGWENLGLKNRENCILIDRHNYERRIAEFLEDKGGTDWRRIAEAGREHAMTELNNDRQVDHLVDWLETL